MKLPTKQLDNVYLQKEKERGKDRKMTETKSSVSEYTFNFFEKNQKKALVGRLCRKLQTAASGTEHTVTNETGKFIPKSYFGSIPFHKGKQRGHRCQIHPMQ